ncbi:hypothetical protein EYC98_19595 [Halieaceae bacterium IMCC14734]|uniref:Photosynthesis system II assembly factor Ycf48/Hcf136-like domain-containing protein n=1 Tax=Candidatus Litorirhabdus singularis TaxID=2518993 RepID=A0ABT3TP29_9GAMM|nr:YCF48-related protein [Candidatus Litorirhabdus singularis]MCX2983072.1 hypothetical protein [Candidatus Litorirhabdus singularis]
MYLSKPASAVLRRLSLAALMAAVLSPWQSAPVLARELPLRATEALALDVATIAKRLLVCGDYGQILYLDDPSHSLRVSADWKLANVPTRTLLTAIYFVDDQRGWAVGHDGNVLASVDGGRNWVLQRDGLQQQKQLNTVALDEARRRYATASAALLAEDEPAQRQQLAQQLEEIDLDLEDAEFLIAEPVHAPPLLDVFFADPLRGVAVGAFNTLLITVDGGVNWREHGAALDNPDGYHINAITGDESGRMWLAAEGGLLYRSSDFGRSWESLESPYPGSWFGIMRQPETDSLLVFGLRGNVYRSDDLGSTWSPVEGARGRTIAGGIYAGSNHALLVGAVGTLLLSNDGGKSFTGTAVPQRVGFSGVAVVGSRVVLVGQGGIHSMDSPLGTQHE